MIWTGRHCTDLQHCCMSLGRERRSQSLWQLVYRVLLCALCRVVMAASGSFNISQLTRLRWTSVEVPVLHTLSCPSSCAVAVAGCLCPAPAVRY